MVIVKTDDTIYMNVDKIYASSGGDYHNPGLYVSNADGIYQVISCDENRAKDMLDDTMEIISDQLIDSNVAIIEFHNGHVCG